MAPTLAEQLNKFEKARQRYFARIKECHDLIGKADKVALFRARCTRLEVTYENYEKTTESLESLNVHVEPPDQGVDTVQPMKAFEDMFFNVKAHLALLDQIAATAIADAVTNDENNDSVIRIRSTCKVNLPTISIPMFSGDIVGFPSWKSLYDEIVHTCDQLSDIQKFTYLKQYLQGPALATIENVSFCPQNYPLAYRTLNEKYSKKRIIAASHLNKILQFQPLARDTLSSLSSYLEDFCATVESLRGLNLPDFREFVLVHHCLRALDPKTRMEFETKHTNTAFPTYDDVVKFVKDKRTVLEVYSVESASASNAYSNQNSNMSKSRPSSNHKMLVTTNAESHVTQHIKPDSGRPYDSARKCAGCGKVGHMLSRCDQFLKMDPSQRFAVVREAKLCFGCFASNHSSGACTSSFKCRFCGSAAHNSLLHRQPSNHQPSQSPSTSRNNPISGVMQSRLQSCSSILLGTATIRVQDSMGNWILARCVIDPGSQISAVTENLAQTLKLPRERSTIQISGIGSDHPIQSRGDVACQVSPYSVTSNETLCINAAVLPKIASDLPSTISSSVMQRFAHLQLADASYQDHNLSSTIDMLIGAEHYAYLITCDGLYQKPVLGYPSAIPSKFGWLLMGSVKESNPSSSTSCPLKCSSLFISSIEDPIASQLQRFWEMENVSESVQENSPPPTIN
uniref:CCHC-type domain-containing protein n=1 Tax=Cacopsylla melanoneura TaxID=428564 RepID=A0A8D9FAQ7_9HEMI